MAWRDYPEGVGDRRAEAGLSLQYVLLVVAAVAAMALLALPIYQGVADVSSARGHLRGQDDMTRAVEVFHLEHGGLLWEVTEASFGRRHDPWNNFALFPSMALLSAPSEITSGGRLRFCISVTGRVSLDVDGDGRADLSAEGLTDEQQGHIEALGLPIIPSRLQEEVLRSRAVIADDH